MIRLPTTQTSSTPASRGAVRIITKDVAMEYASAQVRVNSVHPGYIDIGCGQIAVKTWSTTDGPESQKPQKVSKKMVGKPARWAQRHYNPATKNNATVTMASAAQAGRLQSHTRRPLKETKMEKGRSTSKSASICPALWAARSHS
jgi:NAD(P)-dependent dehydrogenase (short-subunit alcohol dehydrogenase family)